MVLKLFKYLLIIIIYNIFLYISYISGIKFIVYMSHIYNKFK